MLSNNLPTIEPCHVKPIPLPILGLKEGAAHVICNAGGVVTDHEIRSLAISQRLLGTGEIIHSPDPGRPFIPHQNVRGFVYDVASGALREVS